MARGYILDKHVNYDEKSKTPLVSPASGEQLQLHEAVLNNRSGDVNTVGLAKQFDNDLWMAGQWDDSEEPSLIDDTTDAQDAGADDFALQTTTNNDGFVIQCRRPFDLISIDISTAESGGSPAAEVAYWGTGGWTTISNSNLIVAPDFSGTGEVLIAFSQPLDMDVLAAGDDAVDTDELTAGYYAVRVRYTTAPSSTAALASAIRVGKLIDFKEALADNDLLNIVPAEGLLLNGGESIVPVFATASALNSASIKYKVGR